MNLLKLIPVPLSIICAAVLLPTYSSPAHGGHLSQIQLQARAMSQCPSGNFCVWTGTTFTGDVQKIDDVETYVAIQDDPIRSAYNNRSKRTYLNDGPGHSSTYSCFGAGDWDASLSTWQLSAQSVYLSTYTNC